MLRHSICESPSCNLEVRDLDGILKLPTMLSCVGLGNFVTPQSLLQQVVITGNGRVEKLLQKGDIIEIDRTIYSDWAVYVGDGGAVYLASLDPDADILGEEAIILRQPLVDIAGDSSVRINNKIVPAKSRGLTRRPQNDIVQSALKMVGQRVEHNLITRNVEYFVTECAYGRGWSDQAELAQKAMSILSGKVTTPDEAHQALLEGLTTVLGSSPSHDNSS